MGDHGPIVAVEEDRRTRDRHHAGPGLAPRGAAPTRYLTANDASPPKSSVRLDDERFGRVDAGAARHGCPSRGLPPSRHGSDGHDDRPRVPLTVELDPDGRFLERALVNTAVAPRDGEQRAVQLPRARVAGMSLSVTGPIEVLEAPSRDESGDSSAAQEQQADRSASEHAPADEHASRHTLDE